MFLMAFFAFLACNSNPIEKCGVMSVDCCTADSQCLDYFGSEFQYCYFPDESTGVCAECLTDNDCVLGKCLDDGVVGALCVNPIDECESDIIDCCTADNQCVDFWGSEYPFCYSPGESTGVCAECFTHDDCPEGQVCAPDDEFGAFCY
jgi:hypothetical protein